MGAVNIKECNGGRKMINFGLVEIDNCLESFQMVICD